MGEGTIDESMNEAYLWHGTQPDLARNIIAKHGFDERVCNTQGMYGAGIYFAEEACKSGQYCKKGSDGLYTIVVSRVVLGAPYYSPTSLSGIRRPPEHMSVRGLPYDSVIANRSMSKVHRELIVYDMNQCYPEYLIHFRM